MKRRAFPIIPRDDYRFEAGQSPTDERSDLERISNNVQSRDTLARRVERWREVRDVCRKGKK